MSVCVGGCLCIISTRTAHALPFWNLSSSFEARASKPLRAVEAATDDLMGYGSHIDSGGVPGLRKSGSRGLGVSGFRGLGV